MIMNLITGRSYEALSDPIAVTVMLGAILCGIVVCNYIWDKKG